MRPLSRMRIGTRLGLVLVTTLVLIVAVAALGLNGLSRSERSVKDVHSLLEATRDVQELKYFNADLSGWEYSYAWDALASGDPAAALEDDAPFRGGYLDMVEKFQTFLEEFDTSNLTAKENALLDQVRHDLDAFFEMDDKVAARYAAGDLEIAASYLSTEAVNIYTRILDYTADIIDSVGKRSDQVTADAQARADAARMQMIVAALVAVLAGLALLILVRRSITVPLAATTAALRRVGDKDLTVRVDTDERGELGEMAEAINEATAALRETVTTVKDDAARLAEASGIMRDSNAEILQGTQIASGLVKEAASFAAEVSDNAHSVAAGTEEMGASINEISHSATEAATVATTAVTAAADASARIDRLGEASQQIGKVVDTITSIAEQTNLLALNATIEAARAGEMGKGFAVVANEVKELAQETAKATEDISARVGGIQQETAEAVATIRQISDVIGRVNEYVTTIASAVEEQSATTSQMSVSVHQAANGSSQMAENVQSVATIVAQTDQSVESNTRTLEELTQMAAKMDQVTATFTV